MSEMLSIPVVTTRKGILEITSRVLKSSGCLAFLLVFLLAAVSTASALTTLTPGTITASATPTYGATVTLSVPLTGWVSAAAGTITFQYNQTSATVGPWSTSFAAGTCSSAVTAAAANSCTITGIAAGTYYVKAVYTTPNTTTYTSPTTSAEFTLTVAKAALTVAAPTLSEVYGSAVPTITPTYGSTSLKNSDSLASAGVTCTTSYTIASVVGSAQTTSCSGTTANYTTTYTAGAVTVTQATPTVTWSPTLAITYPAPVTTGSQLNASLSVAGSCTYSIAPNTVLLASASTQPLTATCTPTDLVDYTLPSPASTTVQLTVSKGTSTVTWANPTAINYGTLLSATQLNASLGVVPGTCTYASNPVGTQLAAGSHTLQATCTPTDTANYSLPSPTISTASLTVNKTPLTVTASSTTVAANAPVPTITPIYTGFLNSDNAYTAEVAAYTATLTCGTTYTYPNTGSSPWPTSCTGGSGSTANYTYTPVAGSVTAGNATSTSLKIGLATSSATAITTHPAGTSVTLTALVTGTGAAGTVNFTYVDPTSLRTVSIPGCSAVILNSAYAFCTTSTLPVSTNLQLVATFSDSTNTYATSSNATPLAYAVTQTTTTTALTVTAVSAGTTSSVVYGTSVTLTATVTGTGATGVVTFTYGESPVTPIPGCIALPLTAGAGSLTCVTTALPVAGNELLNAYFSNSSNAFSTSSQATPRAFAVTVGTASTTLAVTAVSAGTTSSVVYGTSVTMTASVAGTGATGTVAFSYGSGTPITGCTAVSLSAGTALCTTTALPVSGNEGLVASFTSTSSAYGSSNSSATAFAVTVNAPTITLTATPATPTYGTSVALVVGGLPVGAGAVGSGDTLAFTYTGTAPGTVTCTNVVTISAGGATCNTILLPVQTNTMVATFTPGTAMAVNTGAGPFINATKPTVTVAKATPIVTLTTSPSGTTYVGASVTLTATLPSAADLGTVAFTYGATSAAATAITGCNSVTVSGTTATCVTTALPSAVSPGNYLKAVFTPTTAANVATATGTANLIVEGAVATTTTVTVPAGTNYYGVNPTLTATVSNTSATGTVTFFNNGVSIGNGSALSTGVSTLIPATPLPVGTNLITATFNSSDTTTGYANSTSLVVPVTVVATPTTSVVYAITNANLATDLAGPTAASASTFTKTTASNADNSFVLYATIAPASGTAVINGGHVSFYDVSSGGSVLLGTGTVTAVGSLGTAYFKVNCAVATITCSGPLSLGTRYLTATYGGVYGGTGTAQFAGSISDTVPVLVNGIPTLTITASSPSVVIGAAAPVITPLYTISGGGPAAADWGSNCTATTTVDSNGISVYSCTSMPSFAAAGNRAPVCSTSTSPLFGPTTPVTTTGNANNAVYVTSCTGAKNGNYTIVNTNGVVTVTGKTPTWSNFNAVEVTYGTPVMLAATTNSSGAITYAMSKTLGCVADPTNLTTGYTAPSGPCTLTSIASTGANTATFSATTWPGTYYVTATVAEDDTDSYAKASTQRSVIVIPATPVVNWSEPKAIAFGAFLNTSAFPTCSATYKNTTLHTTKTVTGTCTWASVAQGSNNGEPSANVPNVGSFQAAIFNPSAAYGNGTVNGYNPVVTSLVANVTPIAATITTQPTATAIASGSAVYASGANVSIITPGVAKTGVGGTVLNGTWSWTCSLNGNTCTAITVFPATVSVTFTPSSANYTATSTTVTVTALSTTVVSVWPTASAITYGQTLSNSVLTTGSVVVNGQAPGTVGGKFTWAVPSTVPTVAGSPDKECLIYTPGGADGTTAPVYSTNGGAGTSCTNSPGTGVVSVVVTAGTPTVNWSAVAPPTTYSGLALSTALFSTTDTDADSYTGGVAGLFSWDSAGAASIYPPIGTSAYLTDFTATLTADYAVAKGPVSVTVNPCGLQDSKNSVYAVADYVDTDITGGTNQLLNASFPMTLSGVSNESVLCAVNSAPTVTTVVPSVATPQITLTSTSTYSADSLSNGTNAAVLAYGTNAVATKGATLTITDGGTTHLSDGAAGSITTNSNYSSGVFASMGGTVDITDTNITTSGTYSPALAATNQGTLAIYNVTAANSGDNSSAITTGVGGGQVTVAGGSYSNNDAAGGTTIATAIYAGGTCTNSDGTACTSTTINGQAHPWSTVTVGDGVNNGTTIGSTISAVNGPAVVVEGGNTVSVTSAGLTSLTGNLGNNQGILLYQSGSLTDATPATATHPTTFSMTGGSLTYNCDANSNTNCGGTGSMAVANDQNLLSTIFSVTNTTAAITLKDVTVYNNTNLAAGADGTLLTAAHLSTGPATVSAFTLQGETVTGDIIVDKTSTVNMFLAPDSASVGTIWTGTIANTTYFDNQVSGTTTLGTVNLTLDNTSTWIVNAHSVTLNSLTESTDGNIVYANVLCGSNYSGCTVNITTPTNSGPTTFSPKTSSN